jgi:DNA-binding NtrC family response regulator
MKAQQIKDLALALLTEAEALGADQHPDIEQGISLRAVVRRFEMDLISDALRRSGGHQARAAALLGTKTSTLNHKIKQYRLRPELLQHAVAGNEPALAVSTPRDSPAATVAAADD